jgi:hypothetical protein
MHEREKVGTSAIHSGAFFAAVFVQSSRLAEHKHATLWQCPGLCGAMVMLSDVCAVSYLYAVDTLFKFSARL